MFYRRRRLASRPKRLPRSLWAKKRYNRPARPRRQPSKGSLFVVRKVKELTSTTNGVLGGYAITTNNSIVLGTPVAAPGGTSLYDIPFSIIGRLDELDSYTELTNLFDQFKIAFIRVKVSAAGSTSTNGSFPVPYIDYITDHDDAAVPSVTLMRQKMGVKSRYFNASRPFVVMGCKPRTAVKGVLTAASGQTTNIIPGPTWVNSVYPETEHYAIKGLLRNMYLPAAANNSVLTWDISLGVALKEVQ